MPSERHHQRASRACAARCELTDLEYPVTLDRDARSRRKTSSTGAGK
jgi:hypothetical protein